MVLLKPHSIPSHDVWPSLFGFSMCTKALAPMLLIWERSTSFPQRFLYGVYMLSAEFELRLQMYDVAIVSSS